MLRLSESLYQFSDTCQVYVVRTGADTALLVDFGSGDVLDHLDELGGPRVTDVLMTHHHRDQGQGLARAAAAGIRIWVPHQEQELFSAVDEYWQAREIYDNYNVRQDRFTLLEPVPVAGTLVDYATVRFGEQALTVWPTPGHTPGSITLLVEIDGRRVAFTGDLIAAPGQTWSMAATQWTYHGAEGAAAGLASLLELAERPLHAARPLDLLLPSHGVPINEPIPAINLLARRLRELLDLRGNNPRLKTLREHPYEAITPHVLWNRTSESKSYVLLSESGKALLIDFGYDFTTGIAAGWDRAARRPWLYTLPALHRDFGVRQISAAIPTHYHDDHVAGMNLLRMVEGAEVWAAANFAPILENPAAYDLPCLWFDPIHVDRVLPLDVPIQWEEYAITLYAQPGHTFYAVAVVFEADGKRFLCSGDQYAGDGADVFDNYVYPNGFRAGDYQLTADLYRRVDPDYILTGHWLPYRVEPGYLERLAARGAALARLHAELLPAPNCDPAAAERIASLRPYQAEAHGGEPLTLVAEVRNPLDAAADVTVRPVVPAGWTADARELRVRLGAGETGCVSFHVTPPTGVAVRRARVAVDITAGGQRFGQLAEALVTVC
jgi:glyoxylase-like metal-dependent hydrolase (beta-lactamase superfamily II)